eukprot:4751731-Lingulodinium_polyedra.AAC.1
MFRWRGGLEAAHLRVPCVDSTTPLCGVSRMLRNDVVEYMFRWRSGLQPARCAIRACAKPGVRA